MGKKDTQKQLTILGLYPTEQDKTYFDRVEFKEDLIVIEIDNKFTPLDIGKTLLPLYPKYKTEISSFDKIIQSCIKPGLFGGDEIQPIERPMLLPGMDLEKGFLHLTVL